MDQCARPLRGGSRFEWRIASSAHDAVSVSLNGEPPRRARSHSMYMSARSRGAQRAAALLTVIPWAVACAADPGDAPKQEAGAVVDAPISGDDAPEAAKGDDAGPPPYDAPATDAYDSSTADQSASDGGGDASDGTVVSDAPPDVATCNSCPLVVEYATTTTSSTTQDIRPHVDIYNNGMSPENLAALTVRYWFTADGSTSQAFACDYAMIGCGSVQATFVTMAMPKNEADHYMELSFTGGSIAAGDHTGEIQARFHDTNYQVTFTQTNDYSFDPTKTMYAPWANITLYRNGTLVWGTEPP
jgi:hypothetical protein